MNPQDAIPKRFSHCSRLRLLKPQAFPLYHLKRLMTFAISARAAHLTRDPLASSREFAGLCLRDIPEARDNGADGFANCSR